MIRRNLSPSLHLGFQSPSLRRNASAFDWSRPVQNGVITPRRARTWEPSVWITVPVLSVLGWAGLVLLFSL